jgi:tetratricopeptide (TPR) repeat protein
MKIINNIYNRIKNISLHNKSDIREVFDYFKLGYSIEEEHKESIMKITKNKEEIVNTVSNIVLDHLNESYLYYVELQKMEKKLEQEAEKTSNTPFKFEVGQYISIIDEPISNNENIYRVVGHQNYNNTYGWETTIKNLYSDESVTMFENMLQISNKSEQIKEIINELKDSFSKIEQEDIDLHLKVRLDAIENESELEKAKENYPIVIEWSEGNITDNVGLNNLDELNSKLIEAGFSDRPTEIYIKNKVWFRNYPSYVRIDSSKQKGDFNFEKEHIRDWLKQSDSKFDWSVFDTKGTNQSEIEELEMLIELTQDAVNENPNDEELSLYLDVLKETLSDLKS